MAQIDLCKDSIDILLVNAYIRMYIKKFGSTFDTLLFQDCKKEGFLCNKHFLNSLLTDVSDNCKHNTQPIIDNWKKIGNCLVGWISECKVIKSTIESKKESSNNRKVIKKSNNNSKFIQNPELLEKSMEIKNNPTLEKVKEIIVSLAETNYYEAFEKMLLTYCYLAKNNINDFSKLDEILKKYKKEILRILLSEISNMNIIFDKNQKENVEENLKLNKLCLSLLITKDVDSDLFSNIYENTKQRLTEFSNMISNMVHKISNVKMSLNAILKFEKVDIKNNEFKLNESFLKKLKKLTFEEKRQQIVNIFNESIKEFDQKDPEWNSLKLAYMFLTSNHEINPEDITKDMVVLTLFNAESFLLDEKTLKKEISFLKSKVNSKNEKIDELLLIEKYLKLNIRL